MIYYNTQKDKQWWLSPLIPAKNSQEYVIKASEFISGKQYTNTFKEGNDTVYWNKNTNMAVYTNKEGNIKSAYKVTNQNKVSNYQSRANKQK